MGHEKRKQTIDTRNPKGLHRGWELGTDSSVFHLGHVRGHGEGRTESADEFSYPRLESEGWTSPHSPLVAGAGWQRVVGWEAVKDEN